MFIAAQTNASKAPAFPRSSQNIIIRPSNYAPNFSQEMAKKHGKSAILVTNVGLGPTQEPPQPLFSDPSCPKVVIGGQQGSW